MAEAHEVERCPVLRAWSKSPTVMSFLMKGKVVVLQHPQLGRATLEDNADLVAPLIDVLGPSARIEWNCM